MDIESILKDLEQLPPFPTVVAQALALLDSPDSSAMDVVQVVQYDQAITANVLKVCNSAYFGLPGKVSSLREAVIRLGNKQLKEIILTGTVVKYYKNAMEGYALSKHDLWKHAISTAIISRIISKRFPGVDEGAVFTAGLLHDVGKTILDAVVDEYFNQMFALVGEKGYSFTEAEQEVLGLDHAEIGARMGELWGFPKEIVHAIRFHHAPPEGDESDLVTQVVYLANVICLMLGIGVGRQGLHVRGRDEILEQHGMDINDLQVIMAGFLDEYQKVQDIIDLG
ncbi:HDOD domain-containing protein [Desulfatibacillum aliphaticivorans]|uniref:HDOD domain-containing protein n=1 Tax=Desulfatibacillum aliphaticivorans TaxID=218208 RepID=UPI0003FFCF6D|nr:HDOD domain-containing protein [Desulfatibacillum aliphaticivorans]